MHLMEQGKKNVMTGFLPYYGRISDATTSATEFAEVLMPAAAMPI
ncbi:MAG: hypothetical protein NTX42_02225 [Methanothrix sp.]|nr:hypothetical protein [Methanothrix sp.]